MTGNVFDKFELTRPSPSQPSARAGNVFDQFEIKRPEPAAQTGGASSGTNVFDRFDTPSVTSGLPKAVADFAALQRQGQQSVPESGRGIGRTIGDLATGLGQGAVSATLAIPQIANTLSGGVVDRYLWQPATGAVDRIFGGTGEGSTLAESSQATREAMDEWKSPQLRAREQDLANTKGFFSSAGKILSSPSLLAQQVAEQVPQFSAPAAAARKVGATVLERAGAAALEKGVAKKVAAGLTPEAAAIAARPVAQRIAEREAGKAAGRAVMVAGGAIGASQASEQAQQEVMALPQDVMNANSDYQAARGRGLSDADARRELAIAAGVKAGAIALPLDTLASGLTARLEADIFRGKTGVEGLGELATRRGLGRTAVAAGKEGAEETLQEGGEQLAQNVGVQGVDPNKETWDQVPEQAAIGGTIGAVLGAGGFAGSAALSRDTASVPYPDAKPGSLSDVANAVSADAAGAPAADFVADSRGNVADTRAPAQDPQNGIGLPLRDAAGERDRTPVQEVEAPATAAPPLTETKPASTNADEIASPSAAPPVAPWFDQSTGEMRKPTDDEVKDQFHRMFDQSMAEGLGIGATKLNRHQAAEWGLSFDEAKRLREAALTERNAGFKAGDARPEQGALLNEQQVDPGQPVAAAEPVSNADELSDAPGQPTLVERAEPRRTHSESSQNGGQRSARPDSSQERVQQLVPHASEMPESEVRGLSSVRRQGDSDLQAVDRELSPVPRGHGAETNAESLVGSNQHERELRTEQLPLGDSAGAIGEPPVLQENGLARQQSDGGRDIQGDGNSRSNGSDSTSERTAVVGSGVQGETRNSEEFEVSDVRGPNAERPGMGEGDRSSGENSTGAPATGNSDQASIATPTAPAAEKGVEAAARSAATHPDAVDQPSPAQQAAGNFRAGHVKVHGLDVTIEVPKGGMRRGTARDGTPWERPASDHYGYVKRTEAADGEQVDVYLGPRAEAQDAKVFVIDQVKPGTKQYDESKAMIGFDNGRAARRSYEANFPAGLKTFGGIREMSIDEFKTWVKDGSATKPATSNVEGAQPRKKPAERGGIAPNGARVRMVKGKPEYDTRARETLEAYFKLGAVVPGYAGSFDKVVGFDWNDGRWNVRVREVNSDGTEKLDSTGRPEPDRVHGTQPDARNVVKRLGKPQAPAPKVRALKPIAERESAAPPTGGAFDLPARRGDSVVDDRHTLEVTRAVHEITKSWGNNAPIVRVLRSADELPSSAKSKDPRRYATARGFYDGRSVYLVAPNLSTTDAALRTLAHEVIGHYGVDRILDEHAAGGWNQLVGDVDRLRRDATLGGREMRSAIADVERRYPDADPRAFARELVAIMAERGYRNGLVARVVSAVRAWLRKMFPNLRFGDADIRRLLTKSEDFIRRDDPERAAQQAAIRAMAFDKAAPTDSAPFKRWFAASKVTDATGAPLAVHHGTGEDFTIFDSARAGEATQHATSPLGHYFTEDRALAQRYAENASDGRPADERVIDAYLSVQKPYAMSLKEAQAVETPEAARALRSKLEGDGYDGIRIAEAKTWIAFESGQVKSTENRGTFDRSNPDINFSLPAANMDALDDVQAKPADEGIFDRAKAWLRGKAEDLRPAALGALQRRHLTELMDDTKPLKGFGKTYDERVQRMDADRQQLLAGAPDAAEHPNDMLKRGGAEIADALRKFTYEKGPAGWLGRRRAEVKALADVMHQATIQGLDPSEDYTRLMIENPDGTLIAWTPQALKERIAAIRGQMRGRAGDDKRAMIDEVKYLRNLPARERARERTWPALLAAYQALSPEAKVLYRQQRDWYSQMRDETEKALIARVDAIGRDMAATTGDDLAKRYMRQTVQRIRQQFEAARLEGVYFPLNRDGDFWVSFTDAKGAQGFQMFESAAEAAAGEKKLRDNGFTIEAQGRRDTNYLAKNAPSGTFVAEVIQTLKKAGAPESVQDEIYQAFLRTLPEMSMRKRSIHRKNVAGFNSDILRAFSKNAFHGAHQLARLRHAHELSAIVDAAQASLDNYRRGRDIGETSESSALDVARADALLGELRRRHDYIMAPNDTQLANVANSIGFIYYMGASPAAALVNLTQNAQVTLPVLGARYGWGKASRMLGAAVRDALRTGGNIDRTLTSDEERRAYNVLRARGDIDKTQSHTLAGLAEGQLLQTSPVWSKTMQGVSWLFHKAEIVNREAAGMAAYRLARAAGDSFGDAVQFASDTINGTHFDYSAANRPRYMQGNAFRIALQFKNYSVGMTWMLYRNLFQAFKAQTAAERAVARKTLTGILGVTALMAGTMGLPIINAVRYTANAAHALFGDDDDPWDFATEYRAWLSDHFGADAAKWIADGVVNRAGAAVSGRVGLADLWFREADKELEGRDAYFALLESLAGPMGGLTKNFYVGSQMVGEGQVQRGIETMMPKFAKDAMKALRFAHDGANTLRGDPILPDVSAPETFIQSLGFQPTRLFEQQRTNRALKNYEQFVLDRRQTLMNGYALAVRAGDDRDVAMERIHAFNRQYPELAIKSESLRQSLRARARYSAEVQADGGVAINKKLAPRLRDALGLEQGTST